MIDHHPHEKELAQWEIRNTMSQTILLIIAIVIFLYISIDFISTLISYYRGSREIPLGPAIFIIILILLLIWIVIYIYKWRIKLNSMLFRDYILGRDILIDNIISLFSDNNVRRSFQDISIVNDGENHTEFLMIIDGIRLWIPLGKRIYLGPVTNNKINKINIIRHNIDEILDS